MKIKPGKTNHVPGRSNVVRFPKTAEQATRFKRLRRRNQLLDVSITVLPDRDRYREQRAWRTCFGLYQDNASVPWSKGFKKMPGLPFTGKMVSSNLARFLEEGMPLVATGRIELRINGERARRRLLEVMAG